MYINSILKGSFLCVKTFQPVTTVINKDNNTVVFRLKRDIVERKIADQLKINKYTAT